MQEYVRRGRPGDLMNAEEVYLLTRLVYSGQDCYRLEQRDTEDNSGKKVWILDNGLSELDVTDKLKPSEANKPHVLRINPSLARAYIVATGSHLLRSPFCLKSCFKEVGFRVKK